MSERLLLKGALHEKRMERMTLATRAQGLISAMKVIVQPASVVPLKDLKTAEILELAGELDRIRSEYLRVSADVSEIERELGDG